tara:strand:+ start:114 stop:272 length:159 start_codon:yes stop_codon:yes gene_type:complete
MWSDNDKGNTFLKFDGIVSEYDIDGNMINCYKEEDTSFTKVENKKKKTKKNE